MKTQNFKTNASCLFCQLFPICTPQGLSSEEIQEFQGTIDQHFVLNKGDVLVQTGDSLKYLYAVRTGSCKAFVLTEEGKEQITDFYLTGEMLGLDAIGKKQFPFSIMSLEKTSICRIDYSKLDSLINKYPQGWSHLLKIASNKLNEHTLLLGYPQAEQRLLAFLVDLQKRVQSSGRTPETTMKLTLPMLREDIGNYLNLSSETVSRAFTKLKNKGIVEIYGKLLKLNFD